MGKRFSKKKQPVEVLIEESDEPYEIQGCVINPGRNGDEFIFMINDKLYAIKDAWNNRTMVLTLLATTNVKCIVKGSEVLSIYNV